MTRPPLYYLTILSCRLPSKLEVSKHAKRWPQKRRQNMCHCLFLTIFNKTDAFALHPGPRHTRYVIRSIYWYILSIRSCFFKSRSLLYEASRRSTWFELFVSSVDLIIFHGTPGPSFSHTPPQKLLFKNKQCLWYWFEVFRTCDRGRRLIERVLRVGPCDWFVFARRHCCAWR